MSFAIRGVVEGFYGTPWSQAQRLESLKFLAAQGMNAYMYAPKDDELHRARWREPYPQSSIDEFAGLHTAGDAVGVRVGFAISPGLDIDYAAPRDRAVLLEKCRPLVDAGIDWFLLALDDIPMADGLAPRQSDLANWFLTELQRLCDRPTVMLCPTEYLGTTASGYTNELAATLSTEIALMWTGPTVCSPRITTSDAAAWKAALPHHQLVVWDNYPVNDGTMASRLHLGPYRGRSPDLDSVVHGILLNPMNQAVASRIPLATAAKYLAAPSSYDPDEAFRIACGDDQIVRFASACYDGPPNPPEASPTHIFVEAIINEPLSTGATTRDALQQELLLTKTAAKKITASETPFASEVSPWAQCVAIESRAGLAALSVLDLCAQDPPPVLDLMGAMFAMAFHWANARSSEHVVFGPRFAIYPAIVMHTSGQPMFSARDGILEDRNAIDALCRFAARTADETTAR